AKNSSALARLARSGAREAAVSREAIKPPGEGSTTNRRPGFPAHLERRIAAAGRALRNLYAQAGNLNIALTPRAPPWWCVDSVPPDGEPKAGSRTAAAPSRSAANHARQRPRGRS